MILDASVAKGTNLYRPGTPRQVGRKDVSLTDSVGLTLGECHQNYLNSHCFIYLQNIRFISNIIIFAVIVK